jgi:phosphatidylserine/phosphatidylglycerophosphate/cardiolipin synthase-like enzyme
MIELDQGQHLQELLERAAQDSRGARLVVATPFLEGDSRLYRLLLAAARNGSQVRLLTRLDRRLAQYGLARELIDAGVRLCNLPKLHAKAVTLDFDAHHQRLGWIGSANFTTASENGSLELGVIVAGNDMLESRVLTSLRGLLDGWAYCPAKRASRR